MADTNQEDRNVSKTHINDERTTYRHDFIMKSLAIYGPNCLTGTDVKTLFTERQH